MSGLILLIIVVIMALLVARIVHQAQQARSSGPSPAPGRREKAPSNASGSAAPLRLDQTALAEHVAKLQEAVAGEFISDDEAVGSIVRFSEGALSEEAARELLHGQDVA